MYKKKHTTAAGIVQCKVSRKSEGEGKEGEDEAKERGNKIIEKISGCYDDAQEMVDGNSTFPPSAFFSWNNFVTSKLV